MDEKKSGRLQSLKLPRDLSLGLGKQKKQYTPNLNVVRNKDKPKEILKKNDQKRKERVVQRDRNGRQNHDSRYLQSTGVFSQGTGEIKPVHLEKRLSFRDSTTNSVSNMVMPTINKNSWTVNKKEEAAILDELSKFDMDSDDEMSFGKASFVPLALPSEAPRKTKSEVPIKMEVGEHHNFLPEPFNSDLYNDENPGFALVKLPDSFAGKGLSDDPNVKKLFDYPLKGMLEGQIGKLIIRKSGRMDVQIGRIKYELNPEQKYESKEDLATIVEGQNGENYIAVLGKVLNNFTMFPDYESLLKKS